MILRILTPQPMLRRAISIQERQEEILETIEAEPGRK
jgi:hypothetical protein